MTDDDDLPPRLTETSLNDCERRLLALQTKLKAEKNLRNRATKKLIELRQEIAALQAEVERLRGCIESAEAFMTDDQAYRGLQVLRAALRGSELVQGKEGKE